MLKSFFKGSEYLVIEEFIGLLSCSCGDVSEDSDWGNEESHAGLFQKWDNFSDNFGVYDCLYFIFVGVWVIWDGPAAIWDDLFLIELSWGYAVAKNWNCIFYKLVFRERTSSAEITDCPAAVFY